MLYAIRRLVLVIVDPVGKETIAVYVLARWINMVRIVMILVNVIWSTQLCVIQRQENVYVKLVGVVRCVIVRVHF